MKRTKPETCEECGQQFLTFMSHKRGKKGWLCSTECVASRRLKVHGRDCKQCGTRYVEESIRKRNGGFCALECRNAFMLSKRTRSCEQCGTSIDCNKASRFCGKDCYSAFKRSKASKHCLCCGKTWYRRDVSRKQSKYATSRFHNCFCSKQCRGRHKTWEANRKSRCAKCGMATGDATVLNCGQCRLPEARTWDRTFILWTRDKWEHVPKSWDDKLRGMISTNMHREAIAKPPRELKLKQKRKTRRRSAWIDKWNEACSEMILKHNREQNKEKDPWRKKLGNWQTNQRKRMRIKEHRSRLKECEQS